MITFHLFVGGFCFLLLQLLYQSKHLCPEKEVGQEDEDSCVTRGGLAGMGEGLRAAPIPLWWKSDCFQ